MKQNHKTQSGFTLVELLVAISIMMSAFAIVLVGLNQQRIKRSVNIAQNETVTNIRKIQSFMLSSRNIGSNNKAVKYYIIQFKKDDTNYTVRAVDSEYNYYTLENIKLTDGVYMQDMIMTDRDGNVKSTSSTNQCAQVIFAAPFGKVSMHNTNCGADIVNVLQDPVEMAKMSDGKLQLSLKHPGGNAIKNVIIDSFTGTVKTN